MTDKKMRLGSCYNILMKEEDSKKLHARHTGVPPSPAVQGRRIDQDTGFPGKDRCLARH